MRDPVTFEQFAQVIARALDGRGVRRVVIPVKCAHATIGSTPSVPVVAASLGFDWDQGTLFIDPQTPVTLLAPEDLENMKLARKEGQSWAVQRAYERWQVEKDDLVETINKLRTTLLQRGMSTEELEALAGSAPLARPKRRKA